MPIRIGFPRAIALAALGAVACWSTATAIAAEAASDEKALEEVIVTGSRIAAPNAVSTSPIQVVSSQEIQTSGKTDIGDVITALPQNFNNDLGQDLGNGTSGLTTAGGVSTADLRGLGPHRTLVLVDGRRLGQGSPNTAIQSPAPDLDQIPAGLVERVEVVTGGASAAYGSDAIAGVVNFIMKKNFEGIQLDGEFDVNNHHNGNSALQEKVRAFNGSIPATGTTWDGRRRTFSVLMGTNFADNAGNITAFLSYRHQDPVASSQRDFGGCQLNPTEFDDNGNVTGIGCGGSSNSNWFSPGTGPNKGTVYSVFGTGFVPQGSVLTTPPAAFNSQPYIYMTRQDDRYNAAFLAHDTINDYVKPYLQFYFMDDRSHQQIAPGALFKDNQLDPLGAGYYYTNCSNPLLSAQEVATLGCTAGQVTADAANPGSVTVPITIGRRSVEGGGRMSDYEHQNFRTVLGLQGDLGDAWTYDAYGQYYYTTFFNSQAGYLNFQSIANALLVTGTAANPTCINASLGGLPCAPWDIWKDGGVTQDALNYIATLGTAQGSSLLRTLHGEFTGQLGRYGITVPTAHEGVAVNFGYEQRYDHERFQPDGIEQSGLLEGFGAAAVPIDNTLKVDEEFAEVRAPLVQDKTGIKDLLFDAGYRYSKYSTDISSSTYKFELQYAPIEDYRLRVSFDHAIRAPSIVELYNPQNVGLVQASNDPCAPTFSSTNQIIANAAYTLEQCERTGVTAAQYGNGGTTNTIPQAVAAQLQQLQGGNPNLKPEQADTYTIGLNFAPAQIRGFTGSIDYYHIKLNDAVGPVPLGSILPNCAINGDATYCALIHRSSANGTLGSGSTSIQTGGYLVQTNVNIASSLVSGIDLQLNYAHDLPIGSLAFALNGAYLQHQDTTPLPGAHTTNCAGLFGFYCQTINPRWHHLFRTTWLTPGGNGSVSLSWRYLGSVKQDNNTDDPTMHFATWGGFDYVNGTIPAYSYLDLAGSWKATKHLELRLGVNNIADKDPPVISNAIVGGGAANTYSIYDMFGRQLFFAFTGKF